MAENAKSAYEFFPRCITILTGTVLVLLVQRLVFLLETLTVESVVLRLLSNGCNEVVFLRDVGRFLNLSSRPLAGAPVI